MNFFAESRSSPTPESPEHPGSPSKQQQALSLLRSLTSSHAASPPSKVLDGCRQALATLYAGGQLTSLVPLLPLLLSIKGKPFHLQNHFAMEPVYATRIPRRTVFKTARQVSKSTGLAASRLLQSAILPNFSSLYVAPLYIQTTRFSTIVLRPLLRDSPIRSMLLSGGRSVLDNVLQLQFSTAAVQHFSFAFHDAERVRGLSADECDLDEFQDLNPDFIDVIESTMDASPMAIRRYFGTPKTSDNHLQTSFDNSSGGEWVTTCTGCNRDNIASLAHHLMDMIQEQGPSCYHCGKLLEPSTGHYEHERPELRHIFAGYHVPQIIMPMHYADPEKWRELFLSKTSMAPSRFLNEKLGESCDVMATLVSRADLERASTLPWNNGETAPVIKRLGQYTRISLGVDWGGYGLKGVSYTAIAVLGHLPNGTIDVLFMERITRTTGNVQEATRVLELLGLFRASLLGHDYNGAGGARETILLQAGLPINRVVPLSYLSASAQEMVSYVAPGENVARGYYQVDKPRAVTLCCELIKAGCYRFPRFPSWSKKEGDLQSLSDDFTAATEDKIDLDRASSVLVIRTKPGRSDDTLHALVYGSLAYWHMEQRYPDLASRVGVRISAAQQERVSPSNATYDDE